jgi:hypothetical protein
MQQQPSCGHGHTATATNDRGPYYTAEYGLERADSLHGAYSMDCITVTCYNVRVTSYHAPV